MNRLDQIIRPNIRSLKPYSSARDEFKGSAEVFLDANENPFGALNRYPDPLQKELKILLANEKQVDPNMIFVGNGSDEIIDLLFRSFCVPGVDNVISLNPSYGMYQVSAEINDIQLINVDLDERFDITSQKILQSIDNHTKLVFICSPNNPTGNVIDLEIIDTICKEFNGIVVVDEAYIDFADSPSATSILDENWNLLICQTFSKARGLAGARVGYAIASEKIIAVLNKVKPPYNVSQLNQIEAIRALKNTAAFIDQVTLIKKQRSYLTNKLNELPIVKFIYPSEANFLLVVFLNGPELYNWLINKKIVVRNRNNVLANAIRITVGSPLENEKLLTEIKNYCNEKENTIY